VSVGIFQQASVVTGVLSLTTGVYCQKAQKYLNDHELHEFYLSPAEMKEMAEI
jgi:hypothetical protein